jgi:WD40 repeat protein
MQIFTSSTYEKYDPSAELSYRLFLVPGLPWIQTHEICLMMDIAPLDSIAVGYSDGGIRIWSLKTSEALKQDVKEPKHRLTGHSKGIKQLAYSEKYKIMLSAGYEFDIFIWDTMESSPVDKLIGHESSIVGVTCPSGTFNAVSCDIKGVIKVKRIHKNM